MTRKVTTWIGKARQIESAISARVENATRSLTRSTAHHPLETLHAVVDAIETELQPAGRGRQVFPFTQVRVSFAAASPREKARLQAACDGPPSLQQRIEERLAAAGCAAEPFAVSVAFSTKAKRDWSQATFHVDYTRGEAVPPDVTAVPRLELRVVHGAAAHPRHTSTGAEVAIGRGTEVRDSRQRLIRTNQIAFLDGAGDVNQSVSRRHARIEQDGAARSYRLHDESGAQATSVIRDGRGHQVPLGRGLRLRSGDIIVIGHARIEVKIT